MAATTEAPAVDLNDPAVREGLEAAGYTLARHPRFGWMIEDGPTCCRCSQIVMPGEGVELPSGALAHADRVGEPPCDGAATTHRHQDGTVVGGAMCMCRPPMTAQFRAEPHEVHRGDRAFASIRNREPEWLDVLWVIGQPGGGRMLQVRVPGTRTATEEILIPWDGSILVERDVDPTDTIVKRFAIGMIDVGETVSERMTGPYRRVTEIEKFGDIRRIWLEPLPDAPEYLDRRFDDSLWQPNPPAPDPAVEDRRFEAEMEAAADRFDPPPAEVDADELAHLRHLGLA